MSRQTGCAAGRGRSHPRHAAPLVFVDPEADHPLEQIGGEVASVGKPDRSLAGDERGEVGGEGVFGARGEDDVGVGAVGGDDEHDHAAGVEVGGCAPLELLGELWGRGAHEVAQRTGEFGRGGGQAREIGVDVGGYRAGAFARWARLAAHSGSDFGAFTARTGQSALRRISWALDPSRSLPTGVRRRSPMTMSSASGFCATETRSSLGSLPRTKERMLCGTPSALSRVPNSSNSASIRCASLTSYEPPPRWESTTSRGRRRSFASANARSSAARPSGVGTNPTTIVTVAPH